MLQLISLSRSFFILSALFSLQQNALAQQFLLAQKEGSSTLALLGTGTVVKFQYLGYERQIQEFKGRIISMNTDTLYMEALRLRHPEKFQLAVKDIIGFKAYSTARTLSKSVLELGLVGANLALYYGVLAPAALGAGPAILISVASGLGSYLIIKAIYPERIKKTIQNGWSFKVITRK